MTAPAFTTGRQPREPDGNLRENDSDAWSPIQQWLLQLRRRGLSVLIVHHAGKTGGRRGPSRREGGLATSVCPPPPSDPTPPHGARPEAPIAESRRTPPELP